MKRRLPLRYEFVYGSGADDGSCLHLANVLSFEMMITMARSLIRSPLGRKAGYLGLQSLRERVLVSVVRFTSQVLRAPDLRSLSRVRGVLL